MGSHRVQPWPSNSLFSLPSPHTNVTPFLRRPISWSQRQTRSLLIRSKQLSTRSKQLTTSLMTTRKLIRLEIACWKSKVDAPTLQTGTMQMVLHTTVPGILKVRTVHPMAIHTQESQDRLPIKPAAPVKLLDLRLRLPLLNHGNNPLQLVQQHAMAVRRAIHSSCPCLITLLALCWKRTLGATVLGVRAQTHGHLQLLNQQKAHGHLQLLNQLKHQLKHQLTHQLKHQLKHQHQAMDLVLNLVKALDHKRASRHQSATFT